jgi:2'-5' RNA ligase
MRLFVAIDLDEAVRQAVARAQQQLARRIDRDRSLKWVNPAHLHLTLVFLGDVGGTAAPPIIEALSAPLDVTAFSAVFRGFGLFPHRGAPRVLWLGVAEGADRIAELQRRVAMRFERLGVELDRRPFHAHLTLARWRPSKASPHGADVGRALAAGPDLPVAKVDVDHVTLYESRLSPAGPTYTALARATLT